MRILLVLGEEDVPLAGGWSPATTGARLAERGHDVQAIGLRAAEGSAIDLPGRAVPRSGSPEEDAARVADVVRTLVRETPPDVVWATTTEAADVPAALPPTVGLLVTPPAEGRTPASADPSPASPLDPLLRRLLGAAHHIVVASPDEAARLRRAGVLAADRPVTVVGADEEPDVDRLEDELHLAAELARPKELPRRSGLSGLYRAAWARLATMGARRSPVPRPAAPARIAILRVGLIGDQLLLDPLVAALKERHPRTPIDVVVDEPAHVPPWILEGPGLTYHAIRVRSPEGWIRPGAERLRRSLEDLEAAWRESPPEMLVFADPMDTDSVAYFAAAVARAAPDAWRVGLAAAAVPAGFLDEVVTLDGPRTHETTRMAALAQAATGTPQAPRLPRVPGAGPARTPSSAPRVAFHMGASTRVRRWAPERYAALAARLHAELDAGIVLVGGPEERDAAELAFPDGGPDYLTDHVGETTLTQLPGLLLGCDAFVGNDSFPFHLAVACGLPAVVLVGPGTRRYYDYPVGRVTVLRHPLVCSPRHGEECPYMVTCPHAACMQALRVEDAAAAVAAALGESPESNPEGGTA